MSLSLEIMCPSTGSHEEAVISWRDTMFGAWEITIDSQTEGEDAGFLTKCDRMWRTTDADIIGYMHSDMYTLEHGWDARVIDQFRDERVGVVGFVGATQLGLDDIYRTPYDFRQLARADVWSNLSDWEVHGGHEIRSREVAVVDSCAVFVRRSVLSRLAGWPVARYPNSSHCSDLWLCASVYRVGLSTRVVGARVQHRSGGKGAAGSQWLTDRGGDDKFHKDAHRLIYNDFKDVLPIKVRT